MKKILFLTRSYPNSHKSASLLCTHRVINCLRANEKYDIHVLCYRYENELEEEIIDNVIVHRFRPSFWEGWRERLCSNNKHDKLLRVMEVIQKVLTFPWYPSLSPMSGYLFKKTAKELCLKIHFDIVISEHHSRESLICGCYLKSFFDEIKHITILWDPIEGQIPTRFFPKKYTDKAIERLENLSINYSDMIISTGTMRDFYKERIDKGKEKRFYLGFPGIIEPEDEVNTKYLDLLKPNAINVVYSGQLSLLQRNPIPVIELLNKCDAADRMNFIFFSAGDARSKLEGLNIQGSISYHDYIPIKYLHTIYRHADFLLNISHINAKMVPSKLFEYMSYGKPILSFYKTEGDSAKIILNHYSEGISIDLNRNKDENLPILNSFIGTDHKLVSFDVVKELYFDNTPEAYLNLIKRFI